VKIKITILAVIGLIAQSAMGVVISDTNITLSDGGGISGYALTTFQSSASGSTTMWFNVSGETFSWVDSNVDEGSDWYLTSFDDQFTGATIQNDDFSVFFRATDTGYETHDRNVGYGDFYLGVATSAEIGRAFPRDVFGWVHLQNDNGTLTMLGNAVAYDEGGIIIGTTQAVPEPNGLPLLFFASLSFAVLTRRRRGIEALALSSVSSC
jgi:hypothetical protein